MLKSSDGLEIVVPIRYRKPVLSDFPATATATALAPVQASAPPIKALPGVANYFDNATLHKTTGFGNNNNNMTREASVDFNTHGPSLRFNESSSMFHVYPQSDPNSSHSTFQRKKGLYFRRQVIQFNSVASGSLTRAKAELCNATDKEVTII
jgi:hypothetical protein